MLGGEEGPQTGVSGVYIKRLIVLVLLGLIISIRISASENKEIYKENKAIIYNTGGVPADGAWEAYEKARQIELRRQQQAKKASYAVNTDNPCKVYVDQCVCYAKTLVGDFSTWGTGGRNLSGNSGPVVGAVIIFTYNHVGVITAFDGFNITYTDRNGDNKRTVRPVVVTNINNPTIWKYHKF